MKRIYLIVFLMQKINLVKNTEKEISALKFSEFILLNFVGKHIVAGLWSSFSLTVLYCFREPTKIVFHFIATVSNIHDREKNNN